MTKRALQLIKGMSRITHSLETFSCTHFSLSINTFVHSVLDALFFLDSMTYYRPIVFFARSQPQPLELPYHLSQQSQMPLLLSPKENDG